jgi:hypothetical protein
VLVAHVRTLEETELAAEAGVARWLGELERAVAADDEARRHARDLYGVIASAWPRPLRSVRARQPLDDEARSG